MSFIYDRLLLLSSEWQGFGFSALDSLNFRDCKINSIPETIHC